MFAYRIMMVLAVVCAPFAAFAQIIPPSEQPGRERERFTEPPALRAQPGGAAISLPSTVAPEGAEKTKLRVRAVRIEGSTIYSAEQLAPLYQNLIGQDITLAAVYDLARRITAKYGADGYVLSRAIVPPQEINPRGAVIRIQVIEGWVDKVEWPANLPRYRDFFSGYAAKITAERPANIRTIERYLLLAGDLPGLKFSTSLRPSEKQPAASTLVVGVTEKPLDANGRSDNRGTPSRGPNQFQSGATFNNILGQHEALSLSYAGVFPSEQLQYVSANYRQVLSSEGLSILMNGSYSWGRPGTEALELLEFETRSIVVEAGLSFPLVRARERNVTLTGLAFMSENYSDILGESFNADRLRGLRLKADADAADRWRGINQFNVIFSQGVEGLGSTENGNPLASRGAGRVDFSKVEGTVSRMQPLFGSFSAYLSAYGQYAFTSQLSPEQCGYGGRFFGRAFDPSQLLGDHCWEGVAELRYELPRIPAAISQAQVYSFIDYGKVYTIEPAAETPASSNAASAGGGIRVALFNHFNADLQAAKGIDGPRNDWRFFFAVTANY